MESRNPANFWEKRGMEKFAGERTDLLARFFFPEAGFFGLQNVPKNKKNT